MQILSDKIIFSREDWLAGLDPQYSSSSGGIQQGNKGISSALRFNPFRFLGYASPGELAVDMTNASVVAAVQKKCLPYISTESYTIGGTKLYQFDPSTVANGVINAGIWPHTITAHSGTVVGRDLAFYKIGTTQYLFFLWTDTTGSHLGTYNLSTPAIDDDYVYENCVGLAITSITPSSSRTILLSFST